jgi:HPt (histidine-containing phosphotransfer) domain-containing protein
MDRLGGDKALLKELLVVAEKGFPEDIEAVAAAIAGQDLVTARRHAHSVKGGAANIGALAMAEQAQRLEQAAVLVLEVRQLSVELGIAPADVEALEQLAEDRRELGEFFQIDIHAEVPAGLIRA